MSSSSSSAPVDVPDMTIEQLQKELKVYKKGEKILRRAYRGKFLHYARGEDDFETFCGDIVVSAEKDAKFHAEEVSELEKKYEKCRGLSSKYYNVKGKHNYQVAVVECLRNNLRYKSRVNSGLIICVGGMLAYYYFGIQKAA